MSSSSFVSVFYEFMGFFSASNRSTVRVIKDNNDIVSVASSATLSCMKGLSEETIDIEVEERTERAEEKLSPRIGYCTNQSSDVVDR